MELYLNGTAHVKSAEEVRDFLTNRLGEGCLNCELRARSEGVSDMKTWHLWLTVTRDAFLPAVDAMGELDFPHFHVCSGNDDGDTLRSNYHFSLFRACGRGKEVNVTLVVSVPKSDPVLPSLHSRVPGVGFSEREMNEMLGIVHEGQPNTDLIFLPPDWDRSILPWRRDETGPENKGVVNVLE